MSGLLDRASKFLTGQDGATATEYAVLLALIIIAVLVAVVTVGERARITFETVATEGLPEGEGG